jgi:hypothetical protein
VRRLAGRRFYSATVLGLGILFFAPECNGQSAPIRTKGSGIPIPLGLRSTEAAKKQGIV